MPTKKCITLAVDVGASNQKALLLDERGREIGESLVRPTPRPATPNAVVLGVAGLGRDLGHFDRAAVGFAGTICDGIVWKAVNFDGPWRGFNLLRALARRLRVPTRVANDADIQGFGAIEGKGVELVVTLGTGFGSALFVDGILVPNLELGHHPFRSGRTYEQRLGLLALRRRGRKAWLSDVQQAIAELRELFSFRRMYIGGGNARLVTIPIPNDIRLVSNRAGLLGGIALWKSPSARR